VHWSLRLRTAEVVRCGHPRQYIASPPLGVTITKMSTAKAIAHLASSQKETNGVKFAYIKILPLREFFVA